MSDYVELVKAFPLIPIQSEEHLDDAMRVVDRLIAKKRLVKGESLYLEVLSDLIEAYEDEHFPIEPPTDGELLQSLLDERGISATELHRQTGIAKSSHSEVLANKRPFSKQMIRKFAEFFDVDVGLLASNV